MALRRRTGLIVAVVALLAAVAVVLVLVLRDGGGDGAGGAATDEPLAYLPADAELLLDIDTGGPLTGLVLAELAPRLSGGALTAADLRGLIGGPAAVAVSGDRALLSVRAPDEDALDRLARRLRPTGEYRGARLYDANGAAVAIRAPTLLAAPDDAALRRALDRRAAPEAQNARRAFDARFDGLPQDTSTRVAFNPRALVARLAPQIAGTAWARSLRDGAAVLTSDDEGLRIPFKVRADPAGLRAQDLPIATGPQVPRAHGDAPLTIGLRTLAQALAFARQTGRLDALGALDALPGFLRPDVDGLTGDATVTSTDLTHLTARTDPPDPGDWSSKLSRLDTLSDLIGGAGVTDLDIANDDGVYTLTRGGDLLARLGVFGRTLVISNDPRANLRAAAQAPPAPPVPDAAGALTARLTADAVRQLVSERLPVPDFALQALGDATGWARAELNGLSGELRLALRLQLPTP